MDNFLILLKVFGFVFKILGYVLLMLIGVWILVAFLVAMAKEAISDIRAKLADNTHK